MIIKIFDESIDCRCLHIKTGLKNSIFYFHLRVYKEILNLKLVFIRKKQRSGGLIIFADERWSC